MLLLFFRKRITDQDHEDDDRGGKKGARFFELKRKAKEVRRSVRPAGAAAPDKRGADHEYDVHYKGQRELERYFSNEDVLNYSISDETITDDTVRKEPAVALNLTVTSDRHPSVKVHAQIWDDDFDENGKSKLDREGVLFGRNLSHSENSSCDYWMRSLQMSRTGNFGVKRKDDGFVIFGIEKKDSSGNIRTVMVREKMNGEKKKRIHFKERGVCYVGDIRFEFETPGCREKSVDNDVEIVRFYDETISDRTVDNSTHAYA